MKTFNPLRQASALKAPLSAALVALTLAAPLAAHADPAKNLGVAGRALTFLENGVTLALGGHDLLEARQKQTRGLEAERRILVSVSKTW